MATLIQRGNGTWYTQFFDSRKSPKKKRIYHSTQIKTIAEALHTSILKDFEDGLFDPWKETWTESLRSEKLEATKRYQEAQQQLHPVTLLQASQEYLNEKKTEIKKATFANYSVVVGLFIGFCGETMLTTELTPFQLREFLAKDGLSVKTQNTYKNWLKTFFKWCVEHRYMADDISSYVKLRKPPKKYPRFMMPEQVEHLIKVIEEDNEPRKHWKKGNHLWIVPIIQTMVYCGLRREEFINLRWHWINFDLEKMTVYVQDPSDFDTKNSEERTITLADKALAVFEELKEARGTVRPNDYVFQDYRGKLTGDHVTKTFARYRKLAGLREGICIHSLRHTALSWLAMAGVDVESIRVFAGHADIETTQKYMHVAPDYHHQKIKSAFNSLL